MSGYVARQKSKQPKKLLNSKSDANLLTSDGMKQAEQNSLPHATSQWLHTFFVEALGQSLRIVRWRSDAADMDSPVRGYRSET